MELLKRWTTRAVALVGGVALAAGLGVTAQAAEAPASDTIVVGTNPTFPPFEMMVGDKVSGFDIDAIQAIAAAEGLKVTVRSMPFSGIIPSLQTGALDVGASGITITKERLSNVDFTDPYYRSGLTVIVKTGSPVHDFGDLKNGRLVATQEATSSASYLAQHGIADDHIKQFQDINAAYQALLSGGVDAVLFDNPVNVMFKAKHPSKVQIVGPLLTGEYYGFAVTKKRPDLAARLNQGLAKIKQNGEYQALFARYFGGDTSGAVLQPMSAEQAATSE